MPFAESIGGERGAFTHRLMGTAEVQVRGFDPTGKSVMEGFLAPNEEDVLGCYDHVVSTGAPLVDPVPFRPVDDRYVAEETISFHSPKMAQA